MNLYLNLDDGTWSTDRACRTRSAPLSFNQADLSIPLRLYLLRLASGPQLTTLVPLPPPFTLLNFSGRAQEDLESADKLLFSAGDFVETTDDEGNPCYEADLSLNGENLTDYLGTVQQKEVLWCVELSIGGDTPRRWTPVPRGTGTAYRDIYRGDAGPDPELEYPAPDQIALITGTNYRIVSGVLQLKNTQTGTWHEVHLTGAEGSEQLVISAA